MDYYDQLEYAADVNEQRFYRVRSIHTTFDGVREDIVLINLMKFSELCEFLNLFGDFTDADHLNFAEDGFVFMMMYPDPLRFKGTETLYPFKLKISVA